MKLPRASREWQSGSTGNPGWKENAAARGRSPSLAGYRWQIPQANQRETLTAGTPHNSARRMVFRKTSPEACAIFLSGPIGIPMATETADDHPAALYRLQICFAFFITGKQLIHIAVVRSGQPARADLHRRSRRRRGFYPAPARREVVERSPKKHRFDMMHSLEV